MISSFVFRTYFEVYLTEMYWSDLETFPTNVLWFQSRLSKVSLKRKFVIQVINNAQMNLEVSLLDFIIDLKKLTNVMDNKTTEYNKDNVHHRFKRHLLNLCFQLIVVHSSCTYSVKRTLNLQA